MEDITELDKKTPEKPIVTEGSLDKGTTEFKVEAVHSKTIQVASNLTGILASTLRKVVDVCDFQYVRLEQILSKDWNK